MKKIIWTCDTEIGELGNNVDNAFSLFVMGRVNGCEVGVNYINKIAGKYKAQITHFMDIYKPKYTKEFVDISEKILSDGHKIELHTHPSVMYGKRYLYEYNISEQQHIIEYGQRFFRKFLGIEPTAHRAVGYAANDDTIRVLAEAGIRIDSSYYHGNKYSKLNIQDVNEINFYQNKAVLEVPVTVFSINKSFMGIELPRKCWQKLDFRNGASVDEILRFIDLSPNDAVIVLFLHSVNFLKRKYSCRKNKIIEISVDHSLMEQYEFLLKTIGDRKDCIWSTIKDIDDKQDGFSVAINRPINIAKSLKRRFSNYIYV